ncbi:MAG: glucosidase, partial [Deinococcota bacterium]
MAADTLLETKQLGAEQQRLRDHRERRANWRNWGPYLSERAWGTVREDYSTAGDAWQYFPFEHAHRRSYRWNEDGLAGISDRYQYLCFALSLWNGQDSILKERMFGLTGPQGNHGEDVKEYYFYLDNTPTHSYMRMLYKYPQQAFPYQQLIDENARRGYDDFEYELLDTGIFNEDRYFDVFVSYAKADQNDLVIEVEVVNRGPDAATLTLLPTLWFRNTWDWGYEVGAMGDVPEKPKMGLESPTCILASHPALGDYRLYADNPNKALFTENTSDLTIFGQDNPQPYVKNAFHKVIVDGADAASNPNQVGTKAAFVYNLTLEAGAHQIVYLRLTDANLSTPLSDAKQVVQTRQDEADSFYQTLCNPQVSADERNIQRQAFAGMLWTKQLYYYDVPQWLDGDPGTPKPPESRQEGRNAHWGHLHNFDIISMPDKWEYPWYATWDSAFHCLPLALIDPDYAKRQLVLFLREWYMHPNGQLPAYEWNFEDVNPPVHAWGAWRVYKIDAKVTGKPDRDFLERVFHKLLLNFTWWVNRKDAEGNNIFEGGFLGMDNISVFDRSASLPTGGYIEQSDGTAWMGFFSLTMMQIALELAKENSIYQDAASKFFEHFLSIAT